MSNTHRESSSVYMQSLYKPRHFFEKKYPPWINSIKLIELFGKSVSPHLYMAFCSWRDIVRLKGDSEIVHVLETDPNAKIIDHLHRIKLLLGYHIEPSPQRDIIPAELFRMFPTQIEGYKIPKNINEMERVLEVWGGLISRRGSYVDSVGKHLPYIIDLFNFDPNIVSFLPKTITMAGYTLVRLMDSFYAPDKKGVEWAEKLFDYLAPTYEERIDLKLKEVVDLLLLAHSDGNVLDVGCGTGLAKKWIDKFYQKESIIRLFGIDISSKMLQKAVDRGETVMKGNIAQISADQVREGFRSSGETIDFFDHAIMSYVDNWTTHEERVRIFRTIHELLKTGGALRFNVYDISSPKWVEYYEHILKEAGFKTMQSTENRLQARDGFRNVGFVFAYK